MTPDSCTGGQEAHESELNTYFVILMPYNTGLTTVYTDVLCYLQLKSSESPTPAPPA